MTSDPCDHPGVVWGDCPYCGHFKERASKMSINDTIDTITIDVEPTLGHTLGHLLGQILAGLEADARQAGGNDLFDRLRTGMLIPQAQGLDIAAGLLACELASLLTTCPQLLDAVVERISTALGDAAVAAELEADAAADTVPLGTVEELEQ
jgi:hypothetical protein